jgi:exodeoxyribonuclease V
MLTEICRQAEGNPIIAMSKIIREGGALRVGEYGESKVVRRDDVTDDDLAAADQAIVGTHAMRRVTNSEMRRARGIEGTDPVHGEKLVCRRNNYDTGLMNGELVTTRGSARESNKREHVWINVVSDEGAGADVEVNRRFFTEDETDADKRADENQFQFNYGVTCHSSQGSQWDNIIVLDESRTFRRDAARWLYTAVTRAKSKLTLAL